MTEIGLQKSMRSYSAHAASVLYAARCEGGVYNRTFRETAMASKRPQREIAHCFKIIQDVMEKSQNNSKKISEHPIVSFAKNFGTYLKMPRDWLSLTQTFAQAVLPNRIDNMEKAWEGRSRASIA